MKYLLLTALLIATLFASGCSIGYDAEDAANDRRQDLWGYILGLPETEDTQYEEYTYEDYVDGLNRVEALK